MWSRGPRRTRTARASASIAQAFNDAGAAVNVEFLVNTTTALHQYQPAAAAFASGSFVVLWTSQSQDGSLEGVYSQRFLLPGTH